MNYRTFVWIGVVCLAVNSGCKTPGVGCGPDLSPPDAGIHALVASRLAEQREHVDGERRWSSARLNEYQRPEDIEAGRAQLDYERSRDQAAARLAGPGSATIETCLACSLECNDRIQARRAAIRAVGGEALINRSRFLPTVTYSLAYINRPAANTDASDDAAEPGAGALAKGDDTHHYVRMSQTILEFGKDAAADVTLRVSERAALFEYEDTVRDVLSEVRKKFYTVVLRGRQLDERKKLREEFCVRYEQMRELEKSRRVLEVDVLTARLNMLNEEARINSLEREILRKKLELLHLMGLSVSSVNLAVAGDIESLDLSHDEAVSLALRRSPSIAAARAAVIEQQRRVREVRWEYVPSTALQAGWKNDRTAAGIKLGSTEGVYSADTFAEAHADEFNSYLQLTSDAVDEDDEGWFVDLSVELPVFQGLKRRGAYRKEKALLDEKQHALRDLVNRTGLNVRKALETVMERRKEVAILKETVQISRERLRVQERLKELGKIRDDALETFRTQFFRDQDAFFGQQIALVEAEEDLRGLMRYFEKN